jgi:hypothetical protein
MLRRTVLIAPIALLFGCVAPSLLDIADSTNAATIKTKATKESIFNWDEVTIVSINDKFLRSIYVGGSLRLNAGTTTIVTKVTFNRPNSPGPFESIVTLKVALPASANLALNNEVSGGDVAVWLEDLSTKQRVGEPGRAPWRITAGVAPVVPIIIKK